ncbi:hypothetical protein D3874_15590 [Oleomonas cavernae]|uniref:Calcium-binding protein n=1 Tax=Oleomonas cavernae TaxID=2320859 RepID=A0A418WE86_9PROT|nr:hypothetical protein [Oleomonas cavernae]RJF88259.1 hypothetical protein D3874_15590 [Oleomonas cavernae]
MVGAESNFDEDAPGQAYVIYGGPAGFSLPQIAGTAGANTLTGSSQSERLIGGGGDDILTGNGGADVYLGGSGGDTIFIGTGSFFRIDGGTGEDSLLTNGNLDFTLIDDAAMKSIEAIDVTGNGAQALVFSASDVLAIEASNNNPLGSGLYNVLFLAGDAADTLHLTGGLVDTGTDFNFGPLSFDLYAVNGHVVLAVQSEFALV